MEGKKGERKLSSNWRLDLSACNKMVFAKGSQKLGSYVKPGNRLGLPEELSFFK